MATARDSEYRDDEDEVADGKRDTAQDPSDGEMATSLAGVRWVRFSVVVLVLATAAVSFYLGLVLGPPMATASPLPSSAQQHRLSLQPTRRDLHVASGSQQEYRLGLLASSVEFRGNQIVFQGLVQNLSDRPIRDLLAVVTLCDEHGEPRMSVSALVENTSLPPGQVSSWTVATRYRPELPASGVEFKEWHIGTVPTRDDRRS